jgi:uncharacterized repeat protein (TIGR03806 family)
MPRNRVLHFVFALVVVLAAGRCSLRQQVAAGFDPLAPAPERLSAYGFFEGALAEHRPAEGVMPYELISPLFSDYAEKKRYVYIPPGKSAALAGEDVLDFPVGSALIKTFYYPLEDGAEHILETRVLLRRPEGWEALPYRWNAEGTDAELALAGGSIPLAHPVSGVSGTTFDYLIPNKNQCKGCHNLGAEVMPIGPKVRNLNKEYAYPDGNYNQLSYWQARGLLSGLPAHPDSLPRLAAWNDPHAGLGERAMAYLEINCGHCHRPEGPANTSGLFLMTTDLSPVHWGIGKAPVAAGRGSGGRAVDIQPGMPDSSILVYRMAHTDPGIRMPELGRQLIHREGLDLVRDWIRAMPVATAQQPGRFAETH